MINLSRLLKLDALHLITVYSALLLVADAAGSDFVCTSGPRTGYFCMKLSLHSAAVERSVACRCTIHVVVGRMRGALCKTTSEIIHPSSSVSEILLYEQQKRHVYVRQDLRNHPNHR